MAVPLGKPDDSGTTGRDTTLARMWLRLLFRVLPTQHASRWFTVWLCMVLITAVILVGGLAVLAYFAGPVTAGVVTSAATLPIAAHRLARGLAAGRTDAKRGRGTRDG